MPSRSIGADAFLPRRRTDWSERLVLVAGALACALGAAAWLTAADSLPAPGAADLLSFEDRFMPPAAPKSLAGNTAIRSVERSALSAVEHELRAAKDVLAQRLITSDWRASLSGDPKPAAALESTAALEPAATPDVPMPRARPAAADVRLAVAPDVALRPDNRSVMQKLSDLLPGRLTMASLTPNSGLFQRGPNLAALGYDGQTAVYDVTAHAVYLPSGVSLEAHSGLGQLRDDPEHVDQHNVGATPPATYDLRLRERLFHGVRALRMLPAEGSSTLGRAGLLVHSYMLGPDGDSNGCISIRDYDRFLKAFDDGEVARVVVVPSLRAAPVARAASQS